MPDISVVFQSEYGHTKCMAEAVASGAGGNLYAINADGNLSDTDWEEFDKADAIIMGSPTYMGEVSWQFKKFADAPFKAWFTQNR